MAKPIYKTLYSKEVRSLEPVEAPKDQQTYFRYSSSRNHGDAEQLWSEAIWAPQLDILLGDQKFIVRDGKGCHTASVSH
jgi:hypothetical protein